MEKRAGEVAALLAAALVTAWMFAVGYNESGWLSWLDLAAGIVVLGGLATTRNRELQGTATWPLAGVLLLALWLFALATGAPRWLTWLNFAVGCGFVVTTVGWLIASGEHAGPRRHAHA
jgi:asparagine N-glycosylation enzyme membrane subunit Stt3